MLGDKENNKADTMINLHVVALTIHQFTVDQLAKELSRVEGVHFESRMVAEHERALEQIGVTELPDVIIIEINGQHEQDISDIERVIKEYGDKLTVFATCKDGDIEVIRRLMRAGVRDVLPQPIQAQELVEEVSQVLADKRARLRGEGAPKGRIVTFLNAKGGSGATTLAVNVAHALVSRHDLRVALVDLDLQFGAVALQLDIKPSSTVLDALANPSRIDSVFVRALLTRHESGLEVLASPADISAELDVNTDAISSLLQALAETVDVVVVDLPRLFMPWTLATMRHSDALMLVIQNTVATLTDARLIIDDLPRLGVTTECLEVINNRAMADSASVTVDRLKETLKRDKIHRVRNDFEVAVKSQDHGVPLEKISDRSSLTKDVWSIAEQIAAHSRDEEPKAPSLLKRLFNINS